MKTTTLLLSGMIALSGAVAISGQAHAADITPATSKTTVTLKTSDKPSEETVKLTAVPDVNFTTTAMDDKTMDIAQDGSGKLSVSDSRGTGTGYQVSVQLSKKFQDDKNHEFIGSTLNIHNQGGVSADNGATDDNKQQTASLTNTTDSLPIVKTAVNKGLGNWDYTIGGSNLLVPQGSYAGSYTGTLTWTLSTVVGG